MPFAVLPILQALGSGLWSFAVSPIGRLVVVGLLAFGYGHHRAGVACDAREAAARAELQRAHALELAREQDAAREIAAVAVDRAEEDATTARSQQAIIASLKKWEPTYAPSPSQLAPMASPRPCFVDGDFADRVRQFDAAGHRAATPSRRPGRIR